MIKEIKKGDRFVCVKVHELWTGKFTSGKIYDANDEYSIVDDNNVSIGFHPNTGVFRTHFIPYTHEALHKFYFNTIPLDHEFDLKELLAKVFEYLSELKPIQLMTWSNDSYNKEHVIKGGITLPPYYNNTNGSLYQIAEQRGWNSYQFDAVKRVDRAYKKGNFKQDIEKTIALLQLWLRESGEK